MRIPKLGLLLLLPVVFWGALGAAAPATPLRLVSDVWPPFTDVQSKPHEAIDLVQAALLRGKVQSQSRIMIWTDAIAQLQQRKLDGSAAMWKSPEREKYLLFSKPYLENRLVLVARKGDRVSAASVAELAGKRLALTKDYAYGPAVTQAPQVTIVYRNSDEDCLRAVLAKEADYLLLDELLVQHLFQFYTAKASELIVAGDKAIVRYPLHFAIRRDYPGAREIIADFDRNMAQMRVDGAYNVLLHVDWIRTDVNGDGVLDYVASSKQAPPKAATTDPYLAHTGYPVFTPESTPPPGMGRTPTYQIDGKTYNTWGDAATSLQGGGARARGPYQYSAGAVLFGF
jgi:polar amino acid transport system substrate-binding protein